VSSYNRNKNKYKKDTYRWNIYCYISCYISCGYFTGISTINGNAMRRPCDVTSSRYCGRYLSLSLYLSLSHLLPLSLAVWITCSSACGLSAEDNVDADVDESRETTATILCTFCVDYDANFRISKQSVSQGFLA